ncbi:hypothetical protein IX39_14045 [Chryseobacterium formosense]|uniref:Uncharacterized protein n=1 Tax=Chryseobacterium formosense TaxID=236814 RepID=A0A085Z289_9FLAO|nr:MULTISPECIES: DUF5687 family protein [Chryseobacterium]KFE98552.1 hypothetical protein IX39_14045 [Chryseobacterium formosense]OCK50446.1 hypothetical protein BA768_04635 [Chryseobacterium sp. CBo1]SFT54898.1 hypothetical protein SAMN05421857_1504 [Chryseobacterium formosense]
MFKRFLKLEWKSFFRGSSVGINLAMKIFRIIGICFFIFWLAMMSFIAYYYVQEEMKEDPLKIISRFLIIGWVIDLVFKYMIQQIPTQNIKPFLTLNIPKKVVVNYTLIKTFLTPLSWFNSIFIITFCGILAFNGYGFLGIFTWFVGVSSMFYLNNFLNLLFNDKENVAIGVGVVIAALSALNYYDIVPVLSYSEKFFYNLYERPYFAVVPVMLFAGLWKVTYNYIRKGFYLDEGLEAKKEIGKTENIAFLNKYGAIGTFINNDIKMLKRNKVTKGVLIGSFMFVFYGLLMFTSEIYSTPTMMMFMGLFVTGGFQFTFGQRVPAFDSAYYPLMMTQNVPYKEYLKAKWWLMNIVTAISIIIALFYAYFGWNVYFAFFAAGLYNIGVNSQFTLWSGAYNKNLIDLNAKEKRVGQKNTLSFKAFILMIPKMILPMVVYGVTEKLFGIPAAVVTIGVLGLIGFLLREKIFDIIIKKYKTEKYSTIEAFKKD